MEKRRTMRSTARLFALSSVALWLGCDSKQSSSPTDDSGNPAYGFIYDQGGSPVSGAQVRIVPVGFAAPLGAESAGRVYRLETDARGRYPLADIPAGQYNIFAASGRTASYQDSVLLNEGQSVPRPDTLRPMGSLSGLVSLQPNHDPRTAAIQVIGSPLLARPDEKGRFSIPDMAGGLYALRVSTTLDQYSPATVTARVAPGGKDSLAEPIQPPFTGVPVLTGLKATYDTLLGAVRLSWNPAQYAGLLGYLVYRTPANSSVFPENPVNAGRISESRYLDTLNWEANVPLDVVRGWEYRVAAQAKTGKIGELYETAAVEAVPPGNVRTTFRFRVLNGVEDSVSLNDTARIEVEMTNPTRANLRFTWSVGKDSTGLRDIRPGTPHAFDTLLYVAPATATRIDLHAKAVDAAGDPWRADFRLNVIEDAPVVTSEEVVALAGSKVALRPQVKQSFGTIRKWEWDIGETGSYKAYDSLGPEVTAPEFGKSIFCRVRVTDDDGQIGTGMVTVKGTNLVPLPPMSRTRWRVQAAAVGSRIFAVGGVSQRPPNSAYGGYSDVAPYRYAQADIVPWLEEYNPDARTWTRRKDMNLARSDMSVIAVDGKIYAMGGWTGAAVSNVVEAYDPTTDTWTGRSPMTVGRVGGQAAVADGRIYVLGGRTSFAQDDSLVLDSYDPVLDRWQAKAKLGGGFGQRVGWVGVGSQILYVGGVNDATTYLYDPAADRFSKSWPKPRETYAYLGFATVLWKGKIVTLSGWENGYNTTYVKSLDPTVGTWSLLPNVDRYEYSSAAVADGRVYILGDVSRFDYPSESPKTPGAIYIPDGQVP
jgi:hypothetical protein